MHRYSVRHGNCEKARDLSGFSEVEHQHANSVEGRENACIRRLICVTIARSRILHLFSKGDLRSLEFGFLGRLAGQLLGRQSCL